MSTLPVDILDRDWQRELNSPRLRGQFAGWRDVEPALAPFRDPLAVLRFLRGAGSSAGKDEVLCALLRHARREPAAARVVLEAMMPGLKKLAGRLLADARDREELWSALLASAWERICTYPVQRRPRKVAANVLLDSMRGTLAALAGARSDPASRAVRLSGRLQAPPEPAGVDALLDAALSAAAITQEEAELILATRVDEVPLSVLAHSRGVSSDTLKHRRSRAERRLRFFLAAPVPWRGAK
jgi:DNA-directed RNA polymerase specialized sigma24 family protein